MKQIKILQNTIQEYAWGSTTVLSEFLGRPSHVKKPMAELWMGAHPKSPSKVVIDGESETLIDIINDNPLETLGTDIARQFNNTLPYLFKVIAADQPLSIQAHPTLPQAIAGFKAENEAGIPINDPARNYKNANHKPKIICALSTFWALNGFRPIDEIIETLTSINSPRLHDFSQSLVDAPCSETLKTFLRNIFKLDAAEQHAIIEEILNYAQYHINHDPLFEWMIAFNKLYPGDVGILISLLLNLVCLEPGDAMYLRPGQLHAYLNGFGIELMANSDNVIRGGLTAKHVDVNELLKIVDFNESPVTIIKPDAISDSEQVYKTPAEEFQLSVINVDQNRSHISDTARSIEIIICTLGFADLIDLADDSVIQLAKGDSAIVPAVLNQYKIEGIATLYKSSVPLKRS